METQARYVLVGAFTLAGMAALLGFLLWLGRVEISRAYAQYDVVFDSVSGLSQDSLVRYNGVDVGSVLSIDLDTDNPQFVRVRIEVNAATPVRQDTVATLSSQGVTGVSFVALEGGSPASDPLLAVPPAPVPVIASEPSVVQELTEAAPDLLNEAIALIEDVRQFTTPENRQSIAAIVDNVESVTGQVDALANDVRAFVSSENRETITAILKNVENVTGRVDALTVRAEALFTAAEATLARTDAALIEAEAALSEGTEAVAGINAVIKAELPALVDGLRATVADVGGAAAALKVFAETGLPEFRDLADEASRVIAAIGGVADRIGRDPGGFLLGDQTPEYRN